jgi:hypothetical protein
MDGPTRMNRGATHQGDRRRAWGAILNSLEGHGCSRNKRGTRCDVRRARARHAPRFVPVVFRKDPRCGLACGWALPVRDKRDSTCVSLVHRHPGQVFRRGDDGVRPLTFDERSIVVVVRLVTRDVRLFTARTNPDNVDLVPGEGNR